jgi:hypothetical protein
MIYYIFNDNSFYGVSLYRMSWRQTQNQFGFKEIPFTFASKKIQLHYKYQICVRLGPLLKNLFVKFLVFSFSEFIYLGSLAFTELLLCTFLVINSILIVTLKSEITYLSFFLSSLSSSPIQKKLLICLRH